MARNKRGKMALYEVMSRARTKPGYRRTLEKMHSQHVHGPEVEDTDEIISEESGVEIEPEVIVEPVSEPVIKYEDEKEPVREEAAEAVPQTGVKWWRKPRIVQVNAGRIEFSMPYQLVIALILGFILIVLVAFQLGQRYYMATAGDTVDNPVTGNQADSNIENEPESLITQDDSNVRSRYNLNLDNESPAKTNVNNEQVSKPTAPVAPVGDHTIILVEYDKKADLEDVQKHFKKYGISTEIVGRPGRYFLQTTQRFGVPSAACSDALIKIKEIGSKYKDEAPDGSKSLFAPHYFSDAYPMKIKE